jgi:hypothetical protein
MNRAVTALLGALVAVALIGGTAIAHEEKFETKVTLKTKDPTAFRGKVKAGGGCREGRTVKVFHLLEYGGERERIGKTTTDQSGAWELPLNAPPAKGNYQAIAKKLVIGDHKCTKGASKVKAVK